MSDGLDRLKQGNFNDMDQEVLPDGSILVTLTKRGDTKLYRFRVRDLYGEKEEVLEEHVIERLDQDTKRRDL